MPAYSARCQPTAMPSARPKSVAMRKPASVVHSVTNELSQIGLRYCHNAPNTSDGAGRMVRGTLSARQTVSQTTNRPTVKSAGDTTLMANSRLSTDQAYQFVHHVLERLRVGHLQVARPRQLDLAAAHDAPRPARHHVHGVGEEHRFAQVVGHQHHGHL